MKKVIIILSLLAPFSAFAERRPSPPPIQEVILGLVYNAEGVIFQVESSGCTKKSAFVILHLETYPEQIILSRTDQDHCNVHRPYGTFIKFTYQELGKKIGDKFDIGNRVKNRITVF